MTPTREEKLFELALEKPAAERPAFLDAVCGEDSQLRQRVESLLAAHEQQSGFLPPEEQPTESVATLLDESVLTEGAGTQIGRYKLLEKLGEGGFGSVWAAEQREPVKRRVALKIIKLGMDTQQVVARFEAERQALALMDHPNIAKVLDAGSTDTGRPYFVMELIKGIPLTKYCDQEKLATQDRLDLFIEVCHAIQHAHQKGIIHRDIKPSNIMVTLHDGVPVPKVIDFGIAKATQAELTEKTIYTQYSQFIGTPAYMSPEQAEMSGLDIDTRSDIYSLGVLLYELLTGTTPFDTKELMQSGLDEMRRIIREREPVKPSTRLSQTNSENAERSTFNAQRSNLPSDLDWIVMKCLEKDRSRRYDTANGLAMDLQRHLNNEPVVARPPSAVYRLQKAWRRNKLMFTAAAAVAASLIVGLAMSTWLFIKEKQAYGDARAAEREQTKLNEVAVKALEGEKRQRDLASQRLYDSLVREARSIRKARQVGYRREVFDRIKQAATLNVEQRDLAQLRREAAASFGDWVGQDPVDIEMPEGAVISALTTDGTLVAIAHSGTQEVSIHETARGGQIARLAMGGQGAVSLAFDTKGAALYVSVLDEPLVVGKRPQAFRLEKWSLHGDGSWMREWSRKMTELPYALPTDNGPVGAVFRGGDAAISVIDLDANSELARVPLDHPVTMWGNPCITRDRRKLAWFSQETTNTVDSQLEMRDLVTGEHLLAASPQAGIGQGLNFSRDGRSLVATYASKLIVYETSHLLESYGFQGIYDDTWGAAPGGPSGVVAIPASQELGERLIQPQSGREIAFLNLPGIPKAQTFSGDGLVLSMTHSRGARILHLKADREKRLLEGHQGGVPAMVFTPDGRQLLSTGKDRTLRRWDLTDDSSQILGSLPAPGQTLAFTPDGSLLACGYYDISDLSLWSFPAGNRVAELRQDSVPRGTTWNCAFSPDGKLLAAVGTGLRVWETARLIPNGSPWIVETNGYASLAFERQGRYLAYQATADLTTGTPGLFLRSVERNARPFLVATNIETNPVQALCFLPKSDQLAYVVRTDRTIGLLEPETWKLTGEIPTRMRGDSTTWYVANLTASPDGTRLAIVTPTGQAVELRDARTGQVLFNLPEEHSTVWWLAWSPDSRQLAVSRADGEIAIWNLTDVENQLAQLGLKP